MGRKLIDDDKLIEMLKEGKTQKEAAAYFNVSEAAVSKRLKRLTPLPQSLENLSDKEKKFALEIAGGKSQTQAAFDSFEVTSRASAKALGNKLVKKPSVNAAIADLMNYHGMDRSYRVKRLKRHVDNRDPNVSLKALDQSWKLDGAYQEEKPDQTVMTKQEINVLTVNLGRYSKELLRLEAELAWISDEITDKEFKEFLKDMWGKKKDWELRDMYGWLLAKRGMSEAEIEAEKREFDGGMSGIYETGEGFGLE